MFYITLSAATGDAGEWTQAWERFSDWSKEICERYEYVHLSLHLSDSISEDEEYFDEHTMFKVYDAVRRGLGVSGSGVNRVVDDTARNIINEMQNAGILFRERGPRS
jgi:hypothetical protein